MANGWIIRATGQRDKPVQRQLARNYARTARNFIKERETRERKRLAALAQHDADQKAYIARRYPWVTL